MLLLGSDIQLREDHKILGALHGGDHNIFGTFYGDITKSILRMVLKFWSFEMGGSQNSRPAQ